MSDHKGKEPHVLYCDAHKGNSQAFRDGYDRTFGKKPLPHGKKYPWYEVSATWGEGVQVKEQKPLWPGVARELGKRYTELAPYKCPACEGDGKLHANVPGCRNSDKEQEPKEEDAYLVDNSTYSIPEGTDHTEFVWTDPKDWKVIEGNCIDGNSTRD